MRISVFSLKYRNHRKIQQKVFDKVKTDPQSSLQQKPHKGTVMVGLKLDCLQDTHTHNTNTKNISKFQCTFMHKFLKTQIKTEENIIFDTLSLGTRQITSRLILKAGGFS